VSDFEPFDPENPKAAYERFIKTPAQGPVYAWPGGGIEIPVALVRLHRDKCHSCGKRRVLFVLTVYDVPRGLALCATCAGVRRDQR